MPKDVNSISYKGQLVIEDEKIVIYESVKIGKGKDAETVIERFDVTDEVAQRFNEKEVTLTIKEEKKLEPVEIEDEDEQGEM